ncbi:MAG: threonine--tRNA ligase [Chloroflexi bacterium]|nr:threonine--tRNA ligase [Chloroflexota bacterium]
MSQVSVLYNDQETKVDPGTKAAALIKTLVPEEERKKIIAARIDGRAIDLSTPVTGDSKIEFISSDSPEGLNILRHSTSHVMAAAVRKLFPGTKVAIGPSIESGFYYDFDKKTPFIPEDLQAIEAEMKKIIKAGEPYVREEISSEKAVELFEEMGEDYKVELIRDLNVPTVSIYRTGDFVDLCYGPHIPSTSYIKVFKLLTIAGAYWRGSEENAMLQRLYGTAFLTKEELDDHLFKLEEAARRDHRKLGKDLDLYSMHEVAGAGLAFWHPNGGRIRRIIEEFWYDEHYKRGYEVVYSPHIARVNLWKTSGHWDFYRENMYSPMEVEGQEYLVKPMNCPFHIIIYNTKKRSYRELPYRVAEMGTVYRYERSGVLHGLLRVRGFTQDDAHIFCTPEQLKKEMLNCVDLAFFLMRTFGFEEYEVNLATRSESYIGTDEEWDMAESTLAEALTEHGIPFIKDEGGATFYGPKIDIKLKDALGRLWQGPTIQFDFNLPRRFDTNYVGPDGKEHLVYMVHRAVLGSLERFFGCLIEHYAGAFPLWLAPVQAKMIPVTDRQIPYAEKVQEELKKAGFRVEIDGRNEKVGFKIREAQLAKIPYMVIVGPVEEESGNIGVRHRKQGDIGKMNIEDFIARMKEEVESKAIL